MQLYLIRHGQSRNNALHAHTGGWAGRVDDPELTALGHRQAQAMAQLFGPPTQDDGGVGGGYGAWAHDVGGVGLTHVFTSLFVRAVQTGVHVAEAAGLPLVGWTDWHEIGGVYLLDEASGERIGQSGKGRGWFERYYPAIRLPEELDDTGWWNRPYEDRPRRVARAQRVIDTLYSQHAFTEHRIAIISHAGFIHYVLHVLLQMPLDRGSYFYSQNTSITRIDFRDERIFIRYQNRFDHLSPDMLTY